MSEAKRVLHFTTQGLKPRLITVARDAEVPDSKRCGLIKTENQHLDSNLGELDDGTRSRNRLVESRLDDVWDLSSSWEAKLRAEVAEAEESITQLQRDYKAHFTKFSADLQEEIKDTYDKLDNDLYPRQVERVDVIEEAKGLFFSTTVPAAIEAQSGEVSRQLKKAYETFDIEKQKEKNRERKFVHRANEHIQNSAQKALDEAALMAAGAYNLKDDVVEHERRAERMHLRRFDTAVDNVKEIWETMDVEVEVRKSEDMLLLDVILETQQRLQQTILEHFGTDGQPGAPGTRHGSVAGDALKSPTSRARRRRRRNPESRETSVANSPRGGAVEEEEGDGDGSDGFATTSSSSSGSDVSDDGSYEGEEAGGDEKD